MKLILGVTKQDVVARPAQCPQQRRRPDHVTIEMERPIRHSALEFEKSASCGSYSRFVSLNNTMPLMYDLC